MNTLLETFGCKDCKHGTRFERSNYERKTKSSEKKMLAVQKRHQFAKHKRRPTRGGGSPKGQTGSYWQSKGGSEPQGQTGSYSQSKRGNHAEKKRGSRAKSKTTSYPKRKGGSRAKIKTRSCPKRKGGSRAKSKTRSKEKAAAEQKAKQEATRKGKAAVKPKVRTTSSFLTVFLVVTLYSHLAIQIKYRSAGIKPFN